jgi:glycosyltransferase involved in cell wall biosynthesis
MLTQFYAPVVGGEETLVRSLAHGLVAAGHHVAVATLQFDDLPRYEEDGGVRVYRIMSTSSRIGSLYADETRRHVPPVPDPEAVAGLRRILHVEKPEIVHGHNWLVRSFLPLKSPRGPRLVVTLHDYGLVCATRRLIYRESICSGPGLVKCIRCTAHHYGKSKGPATAVANRLMRPLELRVADMYLPVSAFVTRAGIPRSSRTPQRVIPNLINPPAPDWNESDLGRRPAPGFLMFAGDLVPEKGAHVLLDAYRLLSNPPELIMAGRNVSNLVPPVGVRMLGPLPHAATMSLWHECGIAVVPSTWLEPFGLVALEAMMCGRPVVASRIGGLTDVVIDKVTGLSVAPDDAPALAAALQRLIDDPSLASRLGTAGREAAKSYDAGIVVPLVEAAYHEVLNR